MARWGSSFPSVFYEGIAPGGVVSGVGDGEQGRGPESLGAFEGGFEMAVAVMRGEPSLLNR